MSPASYPMTSITTATLPPISEREFMDQVRELAVLYGWRFYHPWNSMHSEAGFPDIVLVRPPRLIFAELKSQDGRVRPEQQSWLDALSACHAMRCDCGTEMYSGGGEVPEVYLWRPSQLSEIATVLA